MLNLALAFILIPAVAGCLLAYLVRHWALAGAIGTGALALDLARLESTFHGTSVRVAGRAASRGAGATLRSRAPR